MAVVIGQPGSSARRIWFIDLFGPPVAVFIAAGLVLPFLMLVFARQNPLFVTLETVVVSAVCLYIWRDDYLEMLAAMRGASNWAKGADGEVRTAAVLSTLPDSYIVFHDFNPTFAGAVASWNVDHVVIGPNGMFVIETKNYSNASVQPAARSSYTRKNVAQVRRSSLDFKDKIRAWSAGKLGDVFVVPILVYAQDGAFVKQPREGDVHVIPLKWLANEITRHNARRQLDPDEIYRIAYVMFRQLEPHLIEAYQAELDRYGVESRRFKIERANARSAASDAVVVEPAVSPFAMSQRELPVGFPGVAPSVCPNCGGQLVQRTARKGPRAGKRFLGCTNFKESGCGFIYNLEA